MIGSAAPRPPAPPAATPAGTSACWEAPGARVDVWRTSYHHPLAGPDAVVDWLRATGLRPFLAPLTPAEAEAFLARYRRRIGEAYPTLDDGTLLLPFPRLFLIASR